MGTRLVDPLTPQHRAYSETIPTFAFAIALKLSPKISTSGSLLEIASVPCLAPSLNFPHLTCHDI